MSGQVGQMFPPSAKFTEKELPDQTGKVRDVSLIFIIDTAFVFPPANELH